MSRQTNPEETVGLRSTQAKFRGARLKSPSDMVRAPNDHINIRILLTTISGIPA